MVKCGLLFEEDSVDGLKIDMKIKNSGIEWIGEIKEYWEEGNIWCLVYMKKSNI